MVATPKETSPSEVVEIVRSTVEICFACGCRVERSEIGYDRANFPKLIGCGNRNHTDAAMIAAARSLVERRPESIQLVKLPNPMKAGSLAESRER